MLIVLAGLNDRSYALIWDEIKFVLLAYLYRLF